MSELDRKIALITGGNSGSVSTARRFVNEGAYVVATELTAAVREIGAR